jgi:tetratricopeptide (TPR) repeat protein
LHEAGSRWPEAEAAYRESFAIRKHLADVEPAHRNIQRDYAIAFEKLGKIERAIKGPGAGLDNLRSALAQFERLAAIDPADANAARSVAVSREVLASVLLDASHRDEARTLYAQALASHEALAARDAGSVQARCDTARLMEFVGDTFDGSPSGRAQACARWRGAESALRAIAGGGSACSTGGPSRLAEKLAQCR